MDIVLDTSAILSGKYVTGSTLTTPSVIDEFQKGGHSWRLMEFAKCAGMQVRQPPEPYRTRATAAARRTGDLQHLSLADIDVLALALELSHERAEVLLITDDYAIQNVAAELSVPVESILQRGIRQRWKWSFRCSSCGQTFDHPPVECTVCGGPVKRMRVR